MSQEKDGFHLWHAVGKVDGTIILLNSSTNSYHDYVVGMPQVGSRKLRFKSD